jgi:hypothetical protein
LSFSVNGERIMPMGLKMNSMASTILLHYLSSGAGGVNEGFQNVSNFTPST